jgi:2'-5' RNA ligase
LRESARIARDRLAGFDGLHMTPLQWLHLTVLVAGPANQIPEQAMSEMLSLARRSVTSTAPITIELSKVIYHPEAIMLAAQPAEALDSIRDAAQQATFAVTGNSGTTDRSSRTWVPHVTLAYSTSAQPADPIIAALGKNLPSCRLTIDAFSLVIQRGSEWLWNWSPVGTVSLPGSLRPCPNERGQEARDGNPALRSPLAALFCLGSYGGVPWVSDPSPVGTTGFSPRGPAGREPARAGVSGNQCGR